MSSLRDLYGNDVKVKIQLFLRTNPSTSVFTLLCYTKLKRTQRQRLFVMG